MCACVTESNTDELNRSASSESKPEKQKKSVARRSSRHLTYIQQGTHLKELAVGSYFVFLVSCEVGEGCIEMG